MMKPVFIISLSAFFFTAAFAQKAEKVYYLKTNNKIVSSKDSADFIITFFPPDSSVDKQLFIVKEFYPDGKLCFVSGSKISKNRSRYPGFFLLTLDGTYSSYFHSGNMMSTSNYVDGKKTGDERQYYSNGNLCNIKTYLNDTTIIYNRCLDSTGKVLLDKGAGKWIEFTTEDFSKDYIETNKNYIEGNIINNLWEGEWRGRKKDSIKVFSTYEHGKLVTGYDMDGTGSKVYFALKTPPEFKGGLEGLYKFIGKNVVYPKTALRNGVQGKVIITLTIKSDGTLTDIKAVRGIGNGCDEAAIKVFEICPSWTPGYQDGQPVNVIYTIPISFTLTN